MTIDPAGQYWSPYLGMGNNPVNGVDSDGCDWYSNGSETKWFNADGLGFSTEDGTSWSQVAGNEPMMFIDKVGFGSSIVSTFQQSGNFFDGFTLDYDIAFVNTTQINVSELQTLFDGYGIIPVIGEFFDVGSSIISFAQGDKLNGTISLASAIPFLGYFATAKKIEGTYETSKAALKAARQANGIPGYISPVTGHTFDKFGRGKLKTWTYNYNGSTYVIRKDLKTTYWKGIPHSQLGHFNVSVNGADLNQHWTFLKK